MKSKHLFVIAALLLVLGVSVFFSTFNGRASINGAIPTAGSSVELCWAAKGGWALTSLLIIIAGGLVYGFAIVRAFAYETALAPVRQTAELSK